MKIRKTKKGNSIRRIVAFLLCMTMVLGLGMQDVMEQVYAEGTPVTVQEGTAQDTEKITEGEQTGDEPAAPEETAPPTEETENEGSTGDTSGDGVQDEPDAGQPGEDTNTGESGGDNTGDTGTETQPGDGSTDTSGEEGNVDTPGEGEGQGTEEGDVTVPTVPEGEEGQKPGEGDAAVPEGEEGQKPGEGDAAASEDTEQADAPEEEEPAEGVAFEDSYTDEKVTIQVSAEAGVIPEGAVLSVTPIEKTEPDESMSDEEKAEAEKINAQYDLTEKKLTEESDENGEVMEGFLAYDISFVVANEDGETQSEVEPAGEVKVVMDFNEAAVPEGVSENAEVSVKHLKEDETAEDGIVVEDVTENAVVTAAEASAPAVETVELTTESFSIFALSWKGTKTLKISVVDSAGNHIGENGDFEFKNVEDDRIDVDTISNQIKSECEVDAEFNKAVYAADGNFSFNAQQIYGIYYDSSGFKYCKQEDISTGNGWGSVGDGEIYFIFGDDPQLETTPVDTVSTKDTITINVFDYVVGNNGDESADWNSQEGINDGHILKFVDERGNDQNYQTININRKNGKGHINAGMVAGRLAQVGDPETDPYSGEYPNLNNEEGNSESLAYLFQPESDEADKENNSRNQYLGLDRLFKDGGNGYLVFDSTESYAYLGYDEDSNSFSNEFSVINIQNFDHENDGGFYPFTQPSNENLGNLKQSQKDAFLGYSGVNHYYGMTIEAGFIQPAGGLVNNQPMKFTFSGDDDVWVFIDGVLVLDLGGIHDPVFGTIDFSTGTVTRTDRDGAKLETDSLRVAFEKVLGEEEAAKYFNADGRFVDYTSHTIKFFYLERGNSDSNCKIEFNLPTIPTNSVSIAKQVTGTDGQGVDYAEDIDFKFNLKVNDAIYGNQKYELWENGERVVDSDGNPVTGMTDSEGNFTLKHTQMAIFSDLPANANYQVSELGAYLNGYKVSIGDTTIELKNEVTGGETIYSAQTDILSVAEDRSVVFKNTIDKTVNLLIKKQITDRAIQDADREFQIKVLIQGKEYNGTYSVGGTSGLTAENGIIKLKDDQTATITGIPYGATIEVIEEGLGNDFPYSPTYSIAGSIVKKDNAAGFGGITGQIVGNGTDDEQATITITNDINPNYAIDIPVEKVWIDPDKRYERFDGVIIQLYRNGELLDGPVEIKKDKEWEYTFHGLDYYDENGDAYKYSIVETLISISDSELTPEDAGYVVKITGDAQTGFTVTNISPQAWWVIKGSLSGEQMQPLDNARFTLTSEDTVYYGRSFKEYDGEVCWWSTLEDMENEVWQNELQYIPDGTYILKETKAPDNYQISGITWTIVIKDLQLISIKDDKGEDILPYIPNEQTRAISFGPKYLYENTVMYELPSTGGPGIHLYMLGGTLLLMAGSLLVYKKRKKEVLGS